MDAREFKERLAALERSFGAARENTNSHHVDGCSRCSNCVFCSGCERCHRCNYCTDCTASTDLTHCARCEACHQLANSSDCASCSRSAYLVLCRDCHECNYCLGCVGLARADFHILNERYERAEYFAILKRLAGPLSRG